MFLFQNRKEVEVRHTCKMCMTEISFTITLDEYNKGVFPIIKEAVHGSPAHKLVVNINKNLEVENFSIEDVISKGVSLSQELSNQVLGDLGLNPKEIEFYLKVTGKGAISLGEVSLILNKSKEDSQGIINKFIQKGLFKEIIGSSPHFIALPPYAAILSQLKRFQQYISSIQTNVPPQLTHTFSQIESEAGAATKLQEYSNFVTNIKNTMLKQMVDQKKELETTFNEIEKMKNITEIISNFETETKKAINNQLMLIDKKKMKEELDRFFKRFMLNLNELLGKAQNDIEAIINSTSSSVESVKKIFADLSKYFSQALMSSENKLTDITESISKSMTDLKSVFSSKVVNTFGEILANIIKRLETSQGTIQEFWDQSKQVSMFTMKDIWFIRTSEAIKSQIKDEIPKAKMRILIVAPTLTDIDMSSLRACPKHINVRVATSVDIHNPDHQLMLKEFNIMTNVQFRTLTNSNIWGINRDSEVAIVCFLSGKDGEEVELAGLGSSTPEHIKILVPVLEDAWRVASKQ